MTKCLECACIRGAVAYGPVIRIHLIADLGANWSFIYDRKRMNLYEKLQALRAIQRRYLPLLETLEDFDIVTAIGFNQDKETPLTLKRLNLQQIGSAATVHRRLARLKRLGIVLQNRSAHDRRNIELTISEETRKAYKRKGRLFGLRGGN